MRNKTLNLPNRLAILRQLESPGVASKEEAEHKQAEEDTSEAEERKLVEGRKPAAEVQELELRLEQETVVR